MKNGKPGFRIHRYTVETPKVETEVRLAVVSDLHGCPYGERQGRLLAAIGREKADVILMPGDMYDDRDSDEPFWDFMRGAAALAPCFYVTGNHEYGRCLEGVTPRSRAETERLKEKVRTLGIAVLEGEKILLPAGGGKIAIMGIDDPFGGRRRISDQYLRCCRQVRPQEYTVLLSHRPERMGGYRYFPGDMVICGHAHGGQWRLPGLKGGVYAPGQGLFPKHAGGLYRRGSGQLLVSCGLCYRYPKLPRFGNPPEIVILRLVPAEKGKRQEKGDWREKGKRQKKGCRALKIQKETGK